MHFWIDKHSGGPLLHCGAGAGSLRAASRRRRFPSSLSATGGGGRRWRGAKPMVTPVHRFQPIECVAAASAAHAHSNVHASSQRRNNGRGPSDLPTRSHAVELDSSVFLDLPLDGGGTGANDPTSQAHSHMGTPNTTLDPAVVAKQSICGLRLSFALLTALIGGARLYADYQGTGFEVLYTLFLILVVTLCAATLYRSMLKRTLAAADPPITGLAVHRPITDDMTPPSLRHTHSSPHSVPPTTPPPPLAEPPPPPYHIAVLLPQHNLRATDEAPPPSYDKAVIVS